jgi:hypothetical protein
VKELSTITPRAIDILSISSDQSYAFYDNLLDPLLSLQTTLVTLFYICGTLAGMNG